MRFYIKVALASCFFGGALYFTFWHRVVYLPSSQILPFTPVVSEITKIDFPIYGGYNPGVVALDSGHYLLAARLRAKSLSDYLWTRAICRKRPSYIGLVELDENFKAAAPVSIATSTIHLAKKEIDLPQDPRLVQVGEKIFILYSNHYNEKKDRRIFLAEVEKQNEKWVLHSPKPLLWSGREEFYREKLIDPTREKNWTPFVWKDELYLVYMIEPSHIVLKPDLETGECREISSQEGVSLGNQALARGGTPAIVYGEDELLSFFHMAVPKGRRFLSGKMKPIYCFGCYTFSRDGKFEVRRTTREPLTGPGLYQGKQKIIFPTGLVKKGSDIILFYGKNDWEMYAARIDQKCLEKVLHKNR